MNSGQSRPKISSEEYRWRATSARKGVTSWVLMTIKSVLYSSYMVGCQQQTSCIMGTDFKLEENITDPTVHFLYTAKICAFKPLYLICWIKVTNCSNGPETLWQADSRSNKSRNSILLTNVHGSSVLDNMDSARTFMSSITPTSTYYPSRFEKVGSVLLFVFCKSLFQTSDHRPVTPLEVSCYVPVTSKQMPVLYFKLDYDPFQAVTARQAVGSV